MIAANRRWVAGAIGALLVAIAAASGMLLRANDEPLPSRAPNERPVVLLLTSLPIALPERFSLDEGGSELLPALEKRYRVVPISTTDAASLSAGRLLLMAQPHAQPAEMLVALDSWVRSGGRLLLLADPRLEWPSELPLGDVARPPSSFPDMGLLAHWGLELETPDAAGPVRLGPGSVLYLSPGRLRSTNPRCELLHARIVAECAIGKGRVTVVADADFVNLEAAGALGADPDRQSGELLDLLARLER